MIKYYLCIINKIIYIINYLYNIDVEKIVNKFFLILQN